MKTSLFAGAAITALLLSSSAFADKQHFVGVITNAAELTSHTTTACATEQAGCVVSFTYDTVSHRICGNGLLAEKLNVHQVHIHEGDATVENGDVIVDLGYTGETNTDTLKFDVVATDAKAFTDLPTAFAETDDTVSHVYFNIHTTEDPNGAVRANIHPDPTNPTLDECLEFDADAGTPPSDAGGPTTTPTDGGGTVIPDAGDTTTSSSDDTSGCSTAPGTSPGSVALMLGVAIALGSIVRKKKKTKI